MKNPETSQHKVWRLWVDTRQRLVSFHETPGCQCLEFHSRAYFQSCVDSYAVQGYRFQ